jgi:hypothetical protein
VRTVGLDGSGFTDPHGHARRAYGITGDALVLVRPDDHVGLVASTADEVLDYLAAL